MRTGVQRWGNSLVERIPRSFADEIGAEFIWRVSTETVDEILRKLGALLKPDPR